MEDITQGSNEFRTLGERLFMLRRRLGFGQKIVAEAAGISVAALSKYEHDQRDPQASALAALARTLRTTSDYLVGLSATPDASLASVMQTLQELARSHPEPAERARWAATLAALEELEQTRRVRASVEAEMDGIVRGPRHAPG